VSEVACLNRRDPEVDGSRPIPELSLVDDGSVESLGVHVHLQKERKSMSQLRSQNREKRRARLTHLRDLRGENVGEKEALGCLRELTPAGL